MRAAFGLVGLALSVVAIGACDEPNYKDTDAVSCMAFLALQSTAVNEGRATGDAAALDAAGVAWRALAEQKYGADDVAQYFAGSVEAFNEVQATELTMISASCLRSAPRA